MNTTRRYTGSAVEAVCAQVPLPKSQLEALKRRTGMLSIEDALQTAVNHYLGCPEISEREEGMVFVSGKVKKSNHGHGHEHEATRKVLAMEMDIITQVKCWR